jgi:ABC-type Na+ efflux pump, permease component
LRARTRTFKATTVLLVVVSLGIALAPILIRWLDTGSGATTIEVYLGDSKPSVDIPAALSGLLNAEAPTTGGSSGTGQPAKPKYELVETDDVTAARARVQDGTSGGLMIVSRTASTGDLAFVFVTKGSILDRAVLVTQQAVATIAVQDRLTHAGIPPIDQAKLFAPPNVTIQRPDPNDTSGITSAEDFANNFTVGFVLAIVLFMAIILYGQWVAYSVVEEKSSRVIEVVLGAASPFELLGGKVVGVGALAITQYAIVFLPAALAVLFQDQIAARVLGGTPAVALSAGLSIPLLLAFGAFFVLGFALYAVLYAGAAALVSRTEDINQIVAPLTIISVAGYLVAVYSSTGLIDPKSTFVVVMSYIPFFSPYLMLSRLGAGLAGPLEAIVAMVILVVTVPIALWVAARFYAAGVLMYGQRPSLRLMLRVLRGAR